ncbi:hypothetical protein L1987_11454 [Smallanthus sonchifolius]|uniref:Uncharacterized protein n=1 Tax=Smallanthus sonchifolius TaxID=185202 RepID=A0ACB9JB05_9ASTR|nr:hypothetical protein L1987_11454 [Smallanthus sonchifolius]
MPYGSEDDLNRFLFPGIFDSQQNHTTATLLQLIVPSPTSRIFSGLDLKDEERKYSNFSFQPQLRLWWSQFAASSLHHGQGLSRLKQNRGQHMLLSCINIMDGSDFCKVLFWKVWGVYGLTIQNQRIVSKKLQLSQSSIF